MTRRLSRRQALSAFGTVSLGALLGACGGSGDGGAPTTSTPVPTEEGGTATVEPQSASGDGLVEKLDASATCRQAVEQTEGPYYFDADRIRSDIREDRDGTPLRLALRVRRADGDCEPIADAVVDIWHCDAGGVYSGFEAGEGERFLRGAQVTNADGIARFTTIYPGFYQGRTVHIHAKVHLDSRTVLTTQLYFDDEVSDRVFAQEPYTSQGERSQRNDGDGIFDDSLLLTLERSREGYLGLMTFDVAA
jgi:protocatechuate 3,4-dioxygenase beta subunit